MELIIYLYLTMLYLLLIIVLVIIPASLNVSLGARGRYINLLIRIFEYGKRRQMAKKVLNEAASGIIDHELKTSISPVPQNVSFNTLDNHFQLSDVCDFLKSGIEALLVVEKREEETDKPHSNLICFQILFTRRTVKHLVPLVVFYVLKHIIEDEVTKRFDAAELPSWNLLSRTNINYSSVQFISFRLTVIWLVGCFVRYFIFLPVRITIVLSGIILLFISMALVPHLPDEKLRRWLSRWSTLLSFRILARGLSIVVHFHNKENMARGGGICVANHTSPIDAIILACDRNYALIGQMQAGIMGAVQKALLKAQDHIFFERGAIKDRQLVLKRMKEHVDDSEKNPILIFPEGTCINNTSVMMFKKGSFEVGGTIYPVAIKYDPIFGNPFWNSMKEPMAVYILNMVTSWAIVCDVWYLPPQQIQEGESAIQFANRVKKNIAVQGGLVDMVWDGGLKRASVPVKMIEQQQERFATRLKHE